MSQKVIRLSELKDQLQLETPDSFLKLRMLWASIETALEKAASTSDDPEEFWEELDSTRDYSQIRKGIEMSSVGFVPEGQIATFGTVDRMGHQAFGCFFTSERFPWPAIDGIPYQPKLQLNLSLLEAEIGLNFGGGLLQLFEFSDDPGPSSEWFLLRRVPREDATEDNLTPFTPFRGNIEEAPAHHFKDFAGLLGDDSAAIDIQKFHKRTFCVPEAFIDGEVCDFFFLLEDLDAETYEHLETEIEQFRSLIDETTDYASELESGEKYCTLFGLHDPGVPLFYENDGDITFFDFCSLSASINGWEDNSRFDFILGRGAIFATFDETKDEWHFGVDWNT